VYASRGQAADLSGKLCVNFLEECTQQVSDPMKAKLKECYPEEKEMSRSILCLIGSDHVCWTVLHLTKGLFLIVLLFCFLFFC